MVGAVSADIVAQDAIDPPALLGKLPAHGDFIARGVAHSARSALDGWMSAWMQLARERLGENFDQSYFSAAPWLYQGLRHNAVLMPSMDRVERLFPILVVAPARCLTQDIYDTLIAAIEAGQSADELRDSLAEIEPKGRAEAASEWFLPEGADQLLPPPAEAEGWSEIEEHFA